MRKLILIITTALFLFDSFSQQTNPAPALPKQDYLAKSKKQKTAAWGLFAVGTVMLVAGAAIAADKAGERWDGQGGEGLEAAGVVAAMGVAAMVGSIPLFIASSRNKRNAASISFKNGRFQYLRNSNLVYKPMPAVSLKINL